MNAPTLDHEERLRAAGFARIAGVDEAGRGCLAGPVVAAAVVLPPAHRIDGLNDSKALSAERRAALAEAIRREAVAVGVGTCSPREIDELNILWAAMEAMRRAADACAPAADFLLVDGNRAFPKPAWPLETLVKGDARSQSIAAASIIAKTERDARMRRLHAAHPHYGWDTNVGYPTKAHYAALAQHGPTPHHRRSFRLTRKA